MSVGKIKEFVVKTGNWSAYAERVEMYFLVNKVTNELKLPTLISVMGEEAYDLLSSLASPSKPSALSYDRAVELLGAHLQPKPSVLAERYKFRQRRQLNESIAEYVSELKKLSKYCDFGSTLDDNLRDQLVCGLKSDVIRQRLFAEEKLAYNRAVTLALSLEAAERDASVVQRDGMEVHKLDLGECLRCGDKRHKAGNCLYKEYVCSLCKDIGHLRRMCPKKEVSAEGNQTRRSAGAAGYYEYGPPRGRGISRGTGGRGRRAGHGWRGEGRGGQQRAPLHLMDEQGSNYDAIDNNEYEQGEEEPMHQMSLSSYRPVCITVKVQNCLLSMEVDTGSALSCISKDVYVKWFGNLNLKPCCLNLKFYDGSTIQPLGFLETIVEYKDVIKTLDLYVIDKGTTNLLGRQWLAELSIPITITKSNLQNNYMVNNKSDHTKIINEIVSRHESLFDGTLGRYRGGTAELCVREGAVPIFCRARPLPYALRERVDAELDAMLHAGVIEPVDHSDWATPLVVVRKADGGLRICADYKGYLIPLLIYLRRVDVKILPPEKCPAFWRNDEKFLCIQQPGCKSEKYGALCPDDMGSVIVCSGYIEGMMTSRLVDRPCGVGFLDMSKFQKFLTCGVDDSRDVIDHAEYMSFDYTTQKPSATVALMTPPMLNLTKDDDEQQPETETTAKATTPAAFF